VSDSDQFYDEESSLGSCPSSHDSLDDSTDSTMELCAPPTPHQRREMPRLLPQFNGLTQAARSKYLMLNGSRQGEGEAEGAEVASDDDIESIRRPKRQQPKLQAQSQAKGGMSLSQASQRFFPHQDPRSKSIKSVEKSDDDKPLNLTMISMQSPLEEDLVQRRVHAMSTHGIGFIVTKHGIDIRPANYHPTGLFLLCPTLPCPRHLPGSHHRLSFTEEEGVLNEGFMSVDDSSHHSKYDRASTTSSPLSLSQSQHNPAAANLPRLPKKKKKGSPEKEKRFVAQSALRSPVLIMPS
jgi:hypothetical protein